MKPEFATNRGHDRVADAIGGHLRYLLDTWAKPFEAAIATAYFNPGGFELLAEALEKIGRVRLLLGAEPTSREPRIRHLDPDTPPERADRAAVRSALEGHARSMEEDRNLLGFEIKADAQAKRLIEWLESGSVEVRRYEEGFLHGKAFIVATDDEGVIAGSSNFTYAGLAKNLELNLGHYQPHVVERVREWFEELWEEAKSFDLAAIYKARFEPHNPWTVYLRMLWERYGKELEEEAAATDARIRLTTFQRDGLWRAKRILGERNGVVIADGVGLGKTFIGGELIRETVQERRQRVLLISPAALRDGPWRSFLHRYMLGGVENISFDQLASDRQLNPDAAETHLRSPVNDYAMVVIDEAHAYRNPETLRADVLRRLLQGSPPKKLVLLTATPVNNSLWDLYNLLSYFVRNDAAFADAGIRSLKAHFAEAMAIDPDDLAPDKLFDVLDSVAVRRTRHFVKQYYKGETIDVDGKRVAIDFPKPLVQKVTYDLNEVFPELFERLEHALDCVDEAKCEHARDIAVLPTLQLARYAPSKYLLSGLAPEQYELQLAGLLRSALLKRFESSAYAFAQTCREMAANHDAFLELLAEGKVAAGEALTEWVRTDTDEIEEFLGKFAEALDAADRYDVEALNQAVVADQRLLLEFAVEAERVTPELDPKLAALADELMEIAQQAKQEAVIPEDERDKRKVVIFSYFADTVKWIDDFLRATTADDERLAVYKDRIVALTGSFGDRADALWGFAPVTTEAPPGADEDRYDILVSTDILAEGLNLQQARHIINYDLPWNPMRLVQRHGRIDRIGSPHDRVWLRCFFPDKQLEGILRLEERLRRKISQAAASVGLEGEVIPGSRIEDVVISDARDEIERLHREEAVVFETGGETADAYSGEEYRQELRSAFENPDIAHALKELPWGSGSGFAIEGVEPGYVFCARVGDHPTPLYRYVGMSNPAEPDIVGDTLTCLSRAHATPDTSRHMEAKTLTIAYDAWAAARQHILESWTHATDPANLQPKVPKVMRDAAQLLRDYPPEALTRDELARLLDAIEAPYGPKQLRLMRAAIRTSEDPREQAKAAAEKAIELGLEPANAPKPLPVISLDDIRLVCWMAIAPADDLERFP